MDGRELLREFDAIIHAQEQKVLALGRVLHPGLTSEDARNPQDIEAVGRSPEFNYEDGLLAGLLSARACLSRCLAECRDVAGLAERSDE